MKLTTECVYELMKQCTLAGAIHLAALRQANSVEVASAVFDSVRHNIETVLMQQETVFGFIQTSMIKRLIFNSYRSLFHGPGHL